METSINKTKINGIITEIEIIRTYDDDKPVYESINFYIELVKDIVKYPYIDYYVSFFYFSKFRGKVRITKNEV